MALLGVLVAVIFLAVTAVVAGHKIARMKVPRLPPVVPEVTPPPDPFPMSSTSTSQVTPPTSPPVVQISTPLPRSPEAVDPWADVALQEIKEMEWARAQLEAQHMRQPA